MNTKTQGAIGVGRAIAHYTGLGYPVFIPVSDISRYDFVVDIDGILQRVEVKTTRSVTNEVQLRTLGGNQSWNRVIKRLSKDDCDLVYLVNINNDVEREFKVEDLAGRSTIALV